VFCVISRPVIVRTSPGATSSVSPVLAAMRKAPSAPCCRMTVLFAVVTPGPVSEARKATWPLAFAVNWSIWK
jgi:hypothetical protein